MAVIVLNYPTQARWHTRAYGFPKAALTGIEAVTGNIRVVIVGDWWLGRRLFVTWLL
jgi:hypothetical protein